MRLILVLAMCIAVGGCAGEGGRGKSETVELPQAMTMVTAGSEAASLEAVKWSAPVGKLQGRLTLSLLREGSRDITVMVEVRNVTSGEALISTYPQMEWRLRDGKGNLVVPGANIVGGGRSGGEWPEQLASVLPGGVRVSLWMRPSGAFAAKQGVHILAVRRKMATNPRADADVWGLEPGEYELSATMTGEKQERGPDNQWTGKMELPAVRFRMEPQEGRAGQE